MRTKVRQSSFNVESTVCSYINCIPLHVQISMLLQLSTSAHIHNPLQSEKPIPPNIATLTMDSMRIQYRLVPSYGHRYCMCTCIHTYILTHVCTYICTYVCMCTFNSPITSEPMVARRSQQELMEGWWLP
jgi:hypothetical protein